MRRRLPKMPIVVPLAIKLSQQAGMAPAEAELILIGVVSSVLAGSVFGDHCSPISDTTIMSAMASSVGVIEHVRTQLPYAITAGLLAILLGTLPTGFGVPWWICWPISFAAVIAILNIVGKPVEESSSDA